MVCLSAEGLLYPKDGSADFGKFSCSGSQQIFLICEKFTESDASDLDKSCPSVQDKINR